jgi:hypothetical protein
VDRATYDARAILMMRFYQTHYTGDALFKTLHSNPLAPYVTRVVQFGSEPLYDQVLPVDQLTEQVILAKQNLSSLGIPVTVSELAYGESAATLHDVNTYRLPQVTRSPTGRRRFLMPWILSTYTCCRSSPRILLPVRNSQHKSRYKAHIEPANNSWHDVSNDLDWFIDHGKGKKMYLDEVCMLTSVSLKASDRTAIEWVALCDVPGCPEQQHLRRRRCREREGDCAQAQLATMTANMAAGLLSTTRLQVRVLQKHRWRWRGLVLAYVSYPFALVSSPATNTKIDIYSDNMEPGYGLYTANGTQKFPFSPKTHC